MRRFYLVTAKSDKTKTAVTRYTMGNFPLWDFVTGNSDADPSTLAMIVDDKKEWCDIVGTPLSLIVVSTKFRDLLVANGFNVDGAVPTRLTGESGESYHSFYSISRAPVLECLDRERSVFRVGDDGLLASLSKVAIVPQGVPDDCHAFRIRDWPAYFVVDDIVKRSAEASGVTGVYYVACD
jgi:hypothetical protein